ncbi:hypothetical protein ASPNIDRAFT_52980 [Aspergillus niger ATCC 1015]|uniref:CHAT domain-containing protein n=1 Tax=Aspergillus niger (strain ATCC 1015 / CBS 113.46 / FGSC A1144 / LSHB Ac4 / NCTC 3858a / NRRL 328 / USDA 3528.7) TaxID=380704 RepID=G3YCZ9_ASPNA|nr:hypothetical protein ASPNIDRAFT_52980 [Aspergillus niger ATCC 1015]
MASPANPRNFSPHGSRSQMMQVPPPNYPISSSPWTAMYLVSPPLPRGVTAVQFNITSHDQGWCSNPSDGIWSWFDVSILGNLREDESPAFSDLTDPSYLKSRPGDFGQVFQDRGLYFKDIPRENQATLGITKPVTKNKIHRSWRQQVITWRLEDGGEEADFLSLLEEGDRLVIWARAQFAGWVNFVKDVRIMVSVDETTQAVQNPVQPALSLTASASDSGTFHKETTIPRHVHGAKGRPSHKEDDNRGSIPQAFNDIFGALQSSFLDVGRTQYLDRLNQELSHFEGLLDDLPVDHVTRPNVLDMAGLLLKFRRNLTGSIADLGRSIAYLQLAVLLRPDEPTFRQHYVMALGDRANRASHGSDLNVASDELKSALASPHWSETQRMDLADIVIRAYLTRYENTQDISDLETACDIILQRDGFSQIDPYTEAQYLDAQHLLWSMRHGDLGGNPKSVGSDIKQEELLQREHLDMIISTTEKALLTIPQNDQRHANLLELLSIRYYRLFCHTSELKDLDSAISRAEKALSLSQSKAPFYTLTPRLHLTIFLMDRWYRKHDIADVYEAASHNWAAIGAAPPYDVLRTILFVNACKILNAQYSVTKDIEYLEFGITRLESLRNDSLERLSGAFKLDYFYELGRLYETKFGVTGTLQDMEQTIDLFGRAVASIPKGNPPKAEMTLKLGMLWLRKYHLTKNIEDVRTGYTQLAESTFASDASPLTRVLSASQMIDILTHNGDWATACVFAEWFLPSLVHASGREVERDDQIYINRQVRGLGSRICAALCRLDFPVEAVLKLEFARGRIMGHLIDAQSDISSLQAVEPKLAEEYESLRQRAFDKSLSSAFQDTPQSQSRHDYFRELAQCEGRIRQITGFEGFLQPLDWTDLPGIVQAGPIVIVNSTCVSTDAILITHLGARALNLPDMTPKAPPEYRQLFSRHGHTRAGDEFHLDVRDIEPELSPEDLTHELLTWLWYTCVKLCLDALASDGVLASGDELSRIWWIGAGAASALPFHAAGDYSNGIPSNGESCLDRVISSYTPTIKALCNARQRASEALPRTRDTSSLLVVAMPETPEHGALYGVRQEVKGIIHSAGHALQIKEMQGPSAADVLSHLQNNTTEMVHFACHGYSDPVNPMDSHLVLQKPQQQEGVPSSTVLVPDQLKLSALLDTKAISRSWIAYLSACSTAEGKDQSLRDEALNIANGFLVAGFSHIIGSLWAADDEAFISRRAAADSEDLNRAVAEAVRDATLETRRKYANNPAAWALIYEKVMNVIARCASFQYERDMAS